MVSVALNARPTAGWIPRMPNISDGMVAANVSSIVLPVWMLVGVRKYGTIVSAEWNPLRIASYRSSSVDERMTDVMYEIESARPSSRYGTTGWTRASSTANTVVFTANASASEMIATAVKSGFLASERTA